MHACHCDVARMGCNWRGVCIMFLAEQRRRHSGLVLGTSYVWFIFCILCIFSRPPFHLCDMFSFAVVVVVLTLDGPSLLWCVWCGRGLSLVGSSNPNEYTCACFVKGVPHVTRTSEDASALVITHSLSLVQHTSLVFLTWVVGGRRSFSC